MQIVRTLQDLKTKVAELEKPLGFVPTMGYLHEGHILLVRQAREKNGSVIVSIFTNPTQFAPEEDLANYPRDIDRDIHLLDDAGTDLVWIPTAEMMYPSGYQTWVDVEELSTVLEGSSRPTHFRGVTTIVAKLFNAVLPDQAYFGQKDAQQVRIIQQMVTDLNYPIEIIVCPIVREEDGLAMSSRNTYLDPEQRAAARCLSRGLFKARKAYRSGERGAEALKQIVEDEVAREPLADLQYVSCADPANLAELTGDIKSCLISMAVYVGETRLIDNILLPGDEISLDDNPLSSG